MSGAALRPSAMPAELHVEAIRRLLAPLVNAVCKDLVPNIIFGGDGFPGSATPGNEPLDYDKHVTTFDDRLLQHAATLSPSPGQADGGERRLSWVMLAMIDLVRRRTASGRLDELALRLFFEAEWPAPQGNALVVPQGQIASRSVTRAGIRPQQDGVVGVRRSRSVEDLAAILPGQLSAPLPILAQRLLDEGFAVYDRPPPRQEPNNLLAVMLAPDPAECRGLSILRAAWWLFAARGTSLFGMAGVDEVRIAWSQSRHGALQCAAAWSNETSGARQSNRTFDGTMQSRMRFLGCETDGAGTVRAVETSAAPLQGAPFVRGRVPIAHSGADRPLPRPTPAELIKPLIELDREALHFASPVTPFSVDIRGYTKQFIVCCLSEGPRPIASDRIDALQAALAEVGAVVVTCSNDAIVLPDGNAVSLSGIGDEFAAAANVTTHVAGRLLGQCLARV